MARGTLCLKQRGERCVRVLIPQRRATRLHCLAIQRLGRTQVALSLKQRGDKHTRGRKAGLYRAMSCQCLLLQ